MNNEHYHDIMKRYMFPPEGGDWADPLDDVMKRNFDMLYKELVLHWVDTEFTQAVTEDARIEASSRALSASSDAGGSTMDNVKTLIRHFTLMLTRQHRQDIVDAIVEDIKGDH